MEPMERMEIRQTPRREIGVVTAEIKELKRQAQSMAIAYVIEIGRRLVEAKAVLPHGEWSTWLSEEVDFSQSTANNYMKIFEEYGSDQLTLFGAVANSQLIANLSYAKALKLLAVPADERESFAEQVNAENISVKELDAAIKEKKAAEERAAELEEKVAELEEASEREKAAKKEAEEAAQQVEELQKALQKERETVAKEKKKAADAIANPKLPPEELKKIRDDAAKKASEETETRLHEEIAAAKERLEKAENEARIAKSFAQKAESELDAMEKRLKTASPEVTAFKTLFDVTQTNAKKLKEMLNTIRASDPELGDKLANAMDALADILKG
jgi:DNA repair exonuclease SbcCD ATPase subunit